MTDDAVGIIIDDATKVSDNLSDLICWWEGFKMGLKLNPDVDHFIVAENGITAARELNIKIKDQLNKLK